MYHASISKVMSLRIILQLRLFLVPPSATTVVSATQSPSAYIESHLAVLRIHSVASPPRLFSLLASFFDPTTSSLALRLGPHAGNTTSKRVP